MDFRTPINSNQSDLNIDHSTPGLMIGSCFSAYMGRRMMERKMPVEVNPFGIQFNPASILQTLSAFDRRQVFTDNDLIRNGDIWVSLKHHGQFSAPDKQEVLTNIRKAAEQGAKALEAAQYVIITLGTAWVYEYIPTGEIVCNCHKLPAEKFVRRKLSVHEIVTDFDVAFQVALKNKNVILTVSPIRHLGDGLEENQLSKSTLIVAAQELRTKYERCFYFPSYEIMMDDLRDYRFYEQDMTHPTPLAQEYIWQQFCTFAFTKQTQALFALLETLQKAMQHKPFNPDTPTHRAFMQRMAEQARALQTENPHLDLHDEITFFETARS